MAAELLHNHPLARYTSWRVGGCAKQFYKPENLADLQLFMQTLPLTEPLLWIGLGSNTLIRDGGFPGTVILTLNCLNVLEQNDDHMIRAEAGVTCAKLAKFCAELDYADGAFLAGIPGTVGGALMMNAGAYGDETWKYVKQVETIDREGRVHIRTPEEFQIAYREVIPQISDEYFVAGYFAFDKSPAGIAKDKLKNLLKKRNDSQPIGQFSCGSVFRNPPHDFAARLIESTGLKGYRIGGAMVSPKHANFIINEGEACADDIERLINHIAEAVLAKHGVALQRECHIVGELQNVTQQEV